MSHDFTFTIETRFSDGDRIILGGVTYEVLGLMFRKSLSSIRYELLEVDTGKRLTFPVGPVDVRAELAPSEPEVKWVQNVYHHGADDLWGSIDKATEVAGPGHLGVLIGWSDGTIEYRPDEGGEE